MGRALSKSKWIPGPATGALSGSVYCTDTGLVINPLVAEADMVGRWSRAFKMAPIPFRGIANFPARGTTASVICPTGCPPSWTCPKQTQLIHRQPGAALVLRRQELQRNQHRRRAGRDLECASTTRAASASGSIRITREKIMAGLREKAKEKQGAHEKDFHLSARPPSTKRSRSCRRMERKPESMPAAPTC